jgi:hypothetical protein
MSAPDSTGARERADAIDECRAAWWPQAVEAPSGFAGTGAAASHLQNRQQRG